MTRLGVTLAITGLVALAPPPAAAGAAGGPVTGVWSQPVDGVRVRLIANRATFLEGGDTGREVEARPEFTVDIWNESQKAKKLRVMPWAAFELTWEIVGADGTRWRPTFFPPGPPPPGDRSAKLVLKPGEQRRWLSLHGISGFNRMDEPPPDGRWFQVLPAGRYAVRLAGVAVGGLKPPLSPGPVEIVVRPADEPAGGLKLALAAERAATTLRAAAGTVDPVRLTVSAVNVGGKPLRIAPRDLLRRFVDYDLQGSFSSTAARRGAAPPATAADYRVLRPGERVTLTVDQVFPGALGSRQISVSGRGWYQLRAICDRSAKEPCPAADCWSGRISSNIVWLRVK
jgi:hypothetical protein